MFMLQVYVGCVFVLVSEFEVEVWFWFGEIYFDVVDFDVVIGVYWYVVVVLVDWLYVFGFYKFVWSYYCVGYYVEVIECFVQLIDYLDEVEWVMGCVGLELCDEVFQYIVLIFVWDDWDEDG